MNALLYGSFHSAALVSYHHKTNMESYTYVWAKAISLCRLLRIAREDRSIAPQI